jgi:hypothetical protein
VFTNVIANISAPKERDVTFTCNVKNLAHYNVSIEQMELKILFGRESVARTFMFYNKALRISLSPMAHPLF